MKLSIAGKPRSKRAGWARPDGWLWMLLLGASGFYDGGLAAQAPANNVQATATALGMPAGLAYDAAGNLYIAALTDNVIRKVDLQGVITTVAGDGEEGFGGDGGPATSALLDRPTDVQVDSAGNIYIVDSHNQRIREVVNGVITTIAGTGAIGFSGDGGPATSATFNHPLALSLDSAGNVYIADSNNQRIRKITGTTITTVAGNGEEIYSGNGGPATLAGIDLPNGVAADKLVLGRFYISDTHNQRIRVVDASGTITTFAGTGVKTFSADGGSPTTTAFARPRGLAVDQNDVLYITDTDNNRVRTVTAAAAATVATKAGDGQEGFSGDTGLARNVSLDLPRSIAVGPSGLLALSDANNDRIRAIGADGYINTVAGLSPALTEALALGGPSTVMYGTGGLTATFANQGLTGTGQVTLLLGSTVVATGTLSGNTASLSLVSLDPGTYTLAAYYGGDTSNTAIASGVVIVTVTPALVTATANAVNIVYGQALPAVGGTITGVLPRDSGNVAATFSTPALATSPAGTYPITAVLSGTAAVKYTLALASNSGNVVIGQATTTTTLIASNASPGYGAPVTLTATVAPEYAGIPTGSIQFYAGTTLLGTASLVGTNATFSTTSLPLGDNQVTAVYVGDQNFLTSVSTPADEIVGGSDFALAVTQGYPVLLTVNGGKAAGYTFTVSPVDPPFNPYIVYSATGLPPGATATFSPAGATLGSNSASLTMTVQTVPLTVPTTTTSRLMRRGGTGGAIALGLLLLPFGRRLRRSGRRLRPMLMGIVVLAGLGIVTGLSGCGVGNGFLGETAQTYTITVTGTATSATGTVLKHSAVVTLTVD